MNWGKGKGTITNNKEPGWYNLLQYKTDDKLKLGFVNMIFPVACNLISLAVFNLIFLPPVVFKFWMLSPVELL